MILLFGNNLELSQFTKVFTSRLGVSILLVQNENSRENKKFNFLTLASVEVLSNQIKKEYYFQYSKLIIFLAIKF